MRGAMRVIVVVVLLFGIVVQGVLLPWSRNRNYVKAGQDNLISSSNNILEKIGHKISRIFSPWSGGVRRNSMEDRRYSSRSECVADWECPSGRCLLIKKQFCNAQAIIQWLFKTGGPKSCYYTKCAQCTNNSHCGADEECRGTRCKKIKVPGAECRFSINCKIWERCFQGECEARKCRRDRDCPANRECNRFRCTSARSTCTGAKSRDRQCLV